MTDRVRYLTINLDRDYRVDDVMPIIKAIKMIKGVHVVHQGKPVSPEDWSARMAVSNKFKEGILELFDKMNGGAE